MQMSERSALYAGVPSAALSTFLLLPSTNSALSPGCGLLGRCPRVASSLSDTSFLGHSFLVGLADLAG